MQVAQGRQIVGQHRADVHQATVGAHGVDTLPHDSTALADRHPSTIPLRAPARRQITLSIGSLVPLADPSAPPALTARINIAGAAHIVYSVHFRPIIGTFVRPARPRPSPPVPGNRWAAT